MPCVEFNNVRYDYKEAEFSVDFSFRIKEGDFALVVGENGCGKSTFSNLLAGHLHPKSGSIFINSTPVDYLPPYDRDIGVIFQEHNLFTHLTVMANLRLASKKTDTDLLKYLLSRLSLCSIQNQLVSTLSGGQLQRVTLARCILQKKRLWVFDEPFSAMDPSTKKTVISVFNEIRLQKKITTLLITHSLNEFIEEASVIVFLRKGQVYYCGSPQDFFRSKNKVIKKFKDNLDKTA